MRHGIKTAVAAVAFATGACASSPPPQEQLTATKGAIQAAEAIQADDPQVAYHLKLAHDELARAQQLIQKEKMVKAERALERAEADAEVALMLAREAQARHEAQAALDEVEQIRRGL